MTALIVALSSPVFAADRFVSTLGDDASNDCLVSTSPCETVAHGLSEAASSDTVKIAVGLYKENLVVDTAMTISLSGGWSADFSAQDPEATPTVLRAAEKRSVISVMADGITIDFTADGLTIEKGKSILGLNEVPSPCDGIGGGICARVDSLGSLSVALSRMRIRKNRAGGSGAGLAARAVDASTARSQELLLPWSCKACNFLPAFLAATPILPRASQVRVSASVERRNTRLAARSH